MSMERSWRSTALARSRAPWEVESRSVKSALTLTPNSVIQADGSTYSGEVTVEVTHLDPHTEMAGAPGDLSALSFSLAGNGTSKNDFASAQLVSYGMLDVTLFSEEGEEARNIDESAPVDISMPISNGELVASTSVQAIPSRLGPSTLSRCAGLRRRRHRYGRRGDRRVELQLPGHPLRLVELRPRHGPIAHPDA